MLIASVIMVLALLAGLLCNRYIRHRGSGDDDAPSLTDMISPLETLAVLMLAFVLVGAAESFGAAEDAVAAEAATVDHLFETADYAPEPFRENLQAATVCYARAVHRHSWPAMQNGQGSPEPSMWATELRASFKQMAVNDDGTVFDTLVSTDRDRSNARRTRIAESSPAIPDIVYWFMALTLAVTIAGYAYSIRLRHGRVHILAVTALTALFVASLLLIRDVDTPYSGPIRIEATEIVDAKQDITEDYAAEFGLDRLPCDEQGDRKQPHAIR